MPVNAMAMPYLFADSMTLSSRMEPPGSAMQATPDLRALNVVAEREERVGSDRHALHLRDPRLLLLARQRLGLLREHTLPLAFVQHVSFRAPRTSGSARHATRRVCDDFT